MLLSLIDLNEFLHYLLNLYESYVYCCGLHGKHRGAASDIIAFKRCFFQVAKLWTVFIAMRESLLHIC